MKKYDYYYSAKADGRIQRMRARQDGRHILCKFKGKVFIEAIAHGEKPMMPDDDLKLIGTGTDADCTYA